MKEITRLKLSHLYFKHYKATPQEIADCVQARVEAQIHTYKLIK